MCSRRQLPPLPAPSPWLRTWIQHPPEQTITFVISKEGISKIWSMLQALSSSTLLFMMKLQQQTQQWVILTLSFPKDSLRTGE